MRGKMVISRRARSDEQKGQRRKDFLTVALGLLREKPFHQITMADVAEKAGTAKGTVFLYFETKEELFLSVASQEFEQLLDSMESSLSNLGAAQEGADEEELLEILRNLLKSRATLVHLLSILHVVLEQNISYNQALAFKKMLRERMGRIGRLVETHLPYLQPGQGMTFLMWMYALLIGFKHMTEPAPVMQRVFVNEPELRQPRITFDEYFFDALRTILDGWRVQNSRGGPAAPRNDDSLAEWRRKINGDSTGHHSI
jgi:AcrR family transcriptional regulator